MNRFFIEIISKFCFINYYFKFHKELEIFYYKENHLFNLFIFLNLIDDLNHYSYHYHLYNSFKYLFFNLIIFIDLFVDDNYSFYLIYLLLHQNFYLYYRLNYFIMEKLLLYLFSYQIIRFNVKNFDFLKFLNL